MKVKFGVRCNGMNRAIEEEFEYPDDTTDEELDKEAVQIGMEAVHFDCWFEKEAPNA